MPRKSRACSGPRSARESAPGELPLPPHPTARERPQSGASWGGSWGGGWREGRWGVLGDSSNYCSQVFEEHQEFLGTLLGEGHRGGGRAEASLGFKDIGAHLLPVTPLHFFATCLHLKVDPVAGSLVYNKIDKIVLGIPPVCDFLPPSPGKPRVRSQPLPVLCPGPRPCAGHVAGALRVGTPFPPLLFFGRPTCLFHGRRSWLLQEALCGECGRHLRKS